MIEFPQFSGRRRQENVLHFSPSIEMFGIFRQSSSYYRVWVAKFTNSGQLSWAKMAGYLQSSYSSYGEGVGIDDSGNVAVSGRFQYLMDFHSNNNQRMYAYQQSAIGTVSLPSGMLTALTNGLRTQVDQAPITAMIWT